MIGPLISFEQFYSTAGLAYGVLQDSGPVTCMHGVAAELVFPRYTGGNFLKVTRNVP